ncbi:MAG: UDP-3-O-(3-hydroxymyristoyl)glucosamine N-acyltransferase, partial [Proteobacteria bacterium]|nr:UDP-3-O-(3-hydroxymyristoyl)glucosamine N-acyltransferase [Pseudomonadota bacterium]
MLLSEIAQGLGLEFTGPDTEITGINTLESAGKTELSFLVNPKYAPLLATTQAAAVICTEDYAADVESALLSSAVYMDLARVGHLFCRPQGTFSGVSEQAVIALSAVLGADVTVYPFAFIGEEVVIGDGCRIFPGCYVGERSSLGNDCTL